MGATGADVLALPHRPSRRLCHWALVCDAVLGGAAVQEEAERDWMPAQWLAAITTTDPMFSVPLLKEWWAEGLDAWLHTTQEADFWDMEPLYWRMLAWLCLHVDDVPPDQAHWLVP